MNSSPAFSTPCAVPRTLPSSNTAAFVFALMLVAGAALWVVGGRLSRLRATSAQPSTAPANMAVAAPWTRSVIESNESLDVATRVDMIERLAMVGQAWCVAVLQRALHDDRDASVRDAADRALLVISARARYET